MHVDQKTTCDEVTSPRVGARSGPNFRVFETTGKMSPNGTAIAKELPFDKPKNKRKTNLLAGGPKLHR